MAMDIEIFAVTAGSVFDEFGHARHGRRACPGHRRDIAVAEAFGEVLGDFQALTPSLELAQCADVAQEVRHVLFGLTKEEGIAERAEPRLLAVAVFGEALARLHFSE